ncbi:MAG: ATP-dependent helicase, partial [Chloroflexota bacterium]
VATRGDGTLLVVAGPGAGKTRAIVARVAHLLLARAVPPGEMMAITFSRRAAGELQDRLAALAGPVLPVGETVWAGTFHALGARVLRRGGAHLFGRPLNFTIYDQDDTERTLRRILGTLGVPANRIGRLVTTARQAISLVKRGSAPAEGAVGEGQEAVPLREVFLRYDDELRDASAFDFDDLVGLATEALDRDPALRAWTQQGARHLLVDEYQDTDPAQEALLRRLSPPQPGAAAPSGGLPSRQGPPAAHLSTLPTPTRDLCVVADPQQSNYAFRGAVPEQVQRFVERWPQAHVVRLEQNYRSTKSIVAIARRLLAPYLNPSYEEGASDAGWLRGLLALRLWTENPVGTPARLWVAPHPEKEADAIARDVAARLADESVAGGEVTDVTESGDSRRPAGEGQREGGESHRLAGWLPEEIAILVRTHAQARPIEAALLRAKVPYALFGGVRFFGREEIKDLLAYLRLAVLPEDAAAFWRIVNTPRRGLGPAALLTIARYALAEPRSQAPGLRPQLTASVVDL